MSFSVHNMAVPIQGGLKIARVCDAPLRLAPTFVWLSLGLLARIVLLASLTRATYAQEQVSLGTDGCEKAPYSVHILSRDPLVIYLPSFLTEREARHVQEVT